MMAPVIGIVQVGDQSMADRYSYFTFTGLFIMVVWGATDLLAWLTPLLRAGSPAAAVAGRVALAAAAAAGVAACAVLTYCQVPYFDGKIAPLEHSLKYYPDNPAHQQQPRRHLLGEIRGKEGQPHAQERRREAAFTQQGHQVLERGGENPPAVLRRLEQPRLRVPVSRAGNERRRVSQAVGKGRRLLSAGHPFKDDPFRRAQQLGPLLL